jgi:COP9 signalosome complex subunit 3
VTFSDPPVQFSKAEIDQVLAEAQNQAALFAALNREVGKSKEFLSKVRAVVRLSAFRVVF